MTPLDDEAEPNCGALAQVNSLGEVSLQASTCLEKKRSEFDHAVGSLAAGASLYDQVGLSI
ncbi:hypothetical protein [Sinorhizobium medicae]|uniref:hypothetical protein n=1 Tax=Sinorhizobium medicae TaxID=110321 RepID=UPI000C7E255B|nr:hypothetical protein [Sinorhizobium medicae]MDX0409268.1 hypothetical protein [Sinorhizobium medicae]MDX0446240.1 hypothetical protein [Sinorhizobium medicae]MDX0470368.1 hypothetical protein [Sinorhizobium medicae]MDX0520454.1 hypothetical protein [Sinorhizobium medicae]MDX0544902.1 hypothetical protein [Sinorhizobium medicae]